MEGVTWIPKQYLSEVDFWKRAGLPHHNEIAVDEETCPGHKLYPVAATYAVQFQVRRDLAIAHIRQAFQESIAL